MAGVDVDQRLVQIRFAVYEPPAPGLPWLSVCLGPKDEIIGVKAFDSSEAAKAKNETCADRLERKFEGVQTDPLHMHVIVH